MLCNRIYQPYAHKPIGNGNYAVRSSSVLIQLVEKKPLDGIYDNRMERERVACQANDNDNEQQKKHFEILYTIYTTEKCAAHTQIEK